MNTGSGQFDTDLQAAERVKRLTITALVSDDDLFDVLVLKGGNAIEFAGVQPVRRSVDVDFSIDGELLAGRPIDDMQRVFEGLLMKTFLRVGLHVFDVKIQEQPPNLKRNVLGDFWGGYTLRFKVIDAEQSADLSEDGRRRRALPLGRAGRREFVVDLSKHEFCEGKQMKEIDGYKVFIYSERMIVCEKIRAICQQMPEYRETVHSGSARPRARDFFDIHHIASAMSIDFTSDEFWDTLRQTFEVKRVPLRLLGKIGDHREFHRDNFASVEQTVLPGVRLEPFDYYVDYVLDRLSPLQPRWEVELPAG